MLSPDVVAIADSLVARLDELCPGLVSGFVVRGAAGGGEFYCGDSFDFTGVCASSPDADQMVSLVRAHSEFRDGVGVPAGVELSGLYTTAAMLGESAVHCGPVPAFVDGAFDEASTVLVSAWVWAQHSSNAIATRGDLPQVGLSDGELETYCGGQLRGYWRKRSTSMAQLGMDRVGVSDGSVAWLVLGAAAVRVALDSGFVLPPSAAGRHVMEHWDAKWHPIVVDALRVREGRAGASIATGLASSVIDSAEFQALSDARVRGQLVYDFVNFCCSIDDR